MNEENYVIELQFYIIKYNLDIELHKKIIGIFRSYLANISKLYLSISENNIETYISNDAKIRILINKFKNKLDKYLNNNGIHKNYLNFIYSNKTRKVSFESNDEQKLYNQIIKGSFDLEEYCLIISDYDTMLSMLYSIASKLGYNNIFKNKYKDAGNFREKSEAYKKLRQAISDVE